VNLNDRIYQGEDDQWYYHTRGNNAAGPFDSEQAAEKALAKQVRHWSGTHSPLQAWPRAWHPGRLFRRSASRHT
jgi:hypothetical protein